MIYTNLESPLGAIIASSENDAITGLWFVGQKYFPEGMDKWEYRPDRRVFKELYRWLDDYFAGKNILPMPKLAPKGTAFQKAVWNMLLKIPYGQLTTYGKIAEGMPKGFLPTSARAVGGAVGHNPISILIPCHRVVGSNGSLTGYAGGLERKRALLNIESPGRFLLPE
ncbi:MAG TPA: methylated-DNA--[protein]-cysteine S-methyltransferase [Spirochaetota bacterium]|jgi:methylated-DNA-[protein]-cysteine S-methyltransferase|nr:methylated-DNA--[protein]-cysteine S-methyltransferase [Spirochaetota bacterium]OPZ36878.1 MAG: Methylated-DNA--protein-cysteine methyltransferase [Spirochaetes bacterium ADurb.BinA120]HNU92888.1 methylated-DNA--[protein]-cysteine S-methyltransferase [Spirochaetota bacterium]HPI14475.1 methylated-DNA--[protein]-cysteine S-methyltransferase [Spirochaetota bacterium]HPV99177.1 methylated-DNA--[protein]-cysteine S-methyltransferase [Spirochaetota bacterium]